jgi:phospholipid methyltransferase
MRFLGRTPVRTFIVYPFLTLLWEFFFRGGTLDFNAWYSPLLVWGYLQYHLCGLYRIKHGGGGPGLETPPDRLVDTGPYAYSRNPMYLGHIIFLIGLTLTLRSVFAAILTVAVATGFTSGFAATKSDCCSVWASPMSGISAQLNAGYPSFLKICLKSSSCAARFAFCQFRNTRFSPRWRLRSRPPPSTLLNCNHTTACAV